MLLGGTNMQRIELVVQFDKGTLSFTVMNNFLLGAHRCHNLIYLFHLDSLYRLFAPCYFQTVHATLFLINLLD